MMGLLERLAGSPEIASRVLMTLGILVLWYVLERILKRGREQAAEQSSSAFQLRRVLSYVTGFAALALIARTWAGGLSGLGTYLGLATAGVAISLQDPLTNLAGWLYVLVRRPFRVGDRIQINTHIGDVVDIRPLRFVMLEVGNWVHADQAMGRVLHVPNGWTFKHPVANYDEVFPYIWNEIEVVVTFESDWRLAKRTLEGILALSAEDVEVDARKHIAANSGSLHLRFLHLTPVVWTAVGESGIKLTMRYLCSSRKRRTSASAIWERVLDAFAAEPTIDFAYPTIRRYDHLREGNTLVAGVKAPVDVAPLDAARASDAPMAAPVEPRE